VCSRAGIDLRRTEISPNPTGKSSNPQLSQYTDRANPAPVLSEIRLRTRNASGATEWK